MMQQEQREAVQLANFSGLALTISFLVIAGIMLLGTPGNPFAFMLSTLEPEQSVAEAGPTDTAVPTVTATELPTVVPSATSTHLPTDTVVPPATNTPQAVAEAVSDAGSAADYDPALVSEGEQLYMQCAACHGPDARGIPNLGKDLVTSEFVGDLTDEELLGFVKTGRPLWDPMNTTGLDMPSKGGNPALTDEDILAIIAYIRSLRS